MKAVKTVVATLVGLLIGATVIAQGASAQGVLVKEAPGKALPSQIEPPPAPPPVPQQGSPAQETPSEGVPPEVNSADGTPTEKYVEPTPALREQLYQQVWAKIAEEYIDTEKLPNWDKFQHKYDGKLQTDEQLDAALTELVTSVGDRWTKYQSRPIIRLHQEMKAKGALQAGVNVRRHADGKWYIDGIEWGSPAYVSVLKENDVIISVNGKPLTDKMTDVDVWDLFVGQQNETLKVLAVLDGKEQEVLLKLFPTEEEQVMLKLLPNDVLYIRLPTFEKPDIAHAFVSQLRKAYFQKKSALTGIVFDLRNNPGGLFDMAILVSSVFIENGTITKTTSHKGLHGTVTEFTTVPMPPFAKRLVTEEHELDFINWAHNAPMVVLINGSSASCSEITAGALQDNKRAYVIGTHSFGKSVGFTVDRLPNGAVFTLTSMKYLTPAGHDIRDKGITPDLVLDLPRDATEDVQLKAADEYIVKVAAERAQQVEDGRNIAGQSDAQLDKSTNKTDALGKNTGSATKNTDGSSVKVSIRKNDKLTLVEELLRGITSSVLILLLFYLLANNSRW